jgi:hypothetical protein
VITADGRFVVYESLATNLVPGFVMNSTDHDVYLYDQLTGTNKLITHDHTNPNADGNRSSNNFEISADGRFIGISSEATNLAPGWVIPIPGLSQVVLYDRLTDKFSLVSHTPVGQNIGGNQASAWPVLSANGAVISFMSRASDLVPGDFIGFEDIFTFVQSPPTVTSVVFGDGTNQRSLVKRIVVTFSEPVSFMGSVASAFTLSRTGPGGALGDVALTVNPTSGPTSSVTITFAGSLTEFGSLVDGVYDFTISAAQVSGVGGALDGNNDGVAGGSYVVVGSSSNSFYRLFGDANGDRKADLIDMSPLIAAMNQPSPIFDFDDKGFVFFTDFERFRERFNFVV